MSKNKPAPTAESPFSLRELREALGDSFLSNRPSFKRCKGRAAKKGVDLERADYDALMADIRRLRALLKEADVDETEFEVERYTVNSWSPGNFQVKAHLRRRTVDARVSPPPVRDYVSTVGRAAGRFDELFIPDIHFGFTCTTIVGEDGVPLLDWQTIHDPSAVAVALAVAEHWQPRTIVILGDLLDLPGLGKWDTSPAQRHQTLSAFQAARQFLADLRAACPASRIVLLEGNHEKRLRDYMCRNASEMLWATSVEGLLGCDEFRVEYVGPYMARHHLDERTWATHGYLIGRTGGESAAKMLKEHPTVNTIFGHTHRAELAFHTTWCSEGQRTVFSMGCGTLARLDNAVPGSMFSNWQQALGWRRCGVPGISVFTSPGALTVEGKVFTTLSPDE
jgi:predicted phosphodiesterase